MVNICKEGNVYMVDMVLFKKYKTIKDAGHSGKKSFLHMVSAYQSELGIALGQIKVDEKSNEITAIPKLPDSLDIKGCVITMDAMGCQKNIVEKIIEKKAKYVLAVKENQKGLYEGIKETVMLSKPTCQYKDIDCDHGRVEERLCRVYCDLTAIPGSWRIGQL